MKQSNLSLLAFFLVVILFFSNITVQALPVARRSNSSPKVVTIHEIVGNTYNYTKGTWKNDISWASENGVDAMALNMGTDSWQPVQIQNA